MEALKISTIEETDCQMADTVEATMVAQRQ